MDQSPAYVTDEELHADGPTGGHVVRAADEGVQQCRAGRETGQVLHAQLRRQ